MLCRTVPHKSSASNSLHSTTGWRTTVRLLPTARICPLSTSKMTVLVFVVPTSMPTRYMMYLPAFTQKMECVIHTGIMVNESYQRLCHTCRGRGLPDVTTNDDTGSHRVQSATNGRQEFSVTMRFRTT